MPIPREAVIWGYRYFLGRDPESETIINEKTLSTTPEAFARTLIASQEFQRKSRMQTLFGDVGRPPAPTTSVTSQEVLKTIRLADLPNACFLNDAARRIDGKVIFPAKDEDLLGRRLRVHFHGQADPSALADIELNLESIPHNLEIHLSHPHQRVSFGAACRGQWLLRMWGKSTATVGSGVTSNQTEVFLCEGGTLDIGDDCMFAKISIHVGDSHAIFDLETGQTLNYSPAPKIQIGSHVWLAERVVVLADTKIGSGSVVGTASIVKGSFAPASMIAGSPAQTKRTGISWTRSHNGEGSERIRAMLATL